MRAARSDRLYVLVVLAETTGLRQSELLGLRWGSVDLELGVLAVSRQLGRDGRLKDLKTEAGKRLVPLPAAARDVLRDHRAVQGRERERAVYWEEHDLVLCTRNGRPIGQRNAHRSWTRILVRAGVEHRGLHHMRHAYVTMLAEQGVHERVAQTLAGHADSRITREVYTHVTARMLDGAAEAVEQAVQGLYAVDEDQLMGPHLGPSADESPGEEAR